MRYLALLSILVGCARGDGDSGAGVMGSGPVEVIVAPGDGASLVIGESVAYKVQRCTDRSGFGHVDLVRVCYDVTDEFLIVDGQVCHADTGACGEDVEVPEPVSLHVFYWPGE